MKATPREKAPRHPIQEHRQAMDTTTSTPLTPDAAAARVSTPRPEISATASPTSPAQADLLFQRLDCLSGRGRESEAEALDDLIASLKERGGGRPLLDALLLKARFDLGLPLIPLNSLSDLAEPVRSQYEDRYVEAIRAVGQGLLNAGKLLEAWPYFRVLGEKEPIVRAIDAYTPGAPGEELDPSFHGVVDLAFNQGVHPVKGFGWILEHYGTCSAISSFEHLPSDEAVRRVCAEHLIRHLHEHLVFSLRSDLERRGGASSLPPEGTPISDLLAGHEELFADDAYHIDVSHLTATVRLGPLAHDPEVLKLARDLTEYGRRLSPRHQYEGDPPFERVFEDHAVYFDIRLGRDVENGLAHFRAKLPPPPPPSSEAAAPADVEESDARTWDPGGESDLYSTLPAQVLAKILVQLDRHEDALEIVAQHLASIPEGAIPGLPSLAQLCKRANRLDRLAALSRQRNDPVQFAAARLER
mgnify:CR=1 FL=1